MSTSSIAKRLALSAVVGCAAFGLSWLATPFATAAWELRHRDVTLTDLGLLAGAYADGLDDGMHAHWRSIQDLAAVDVAVEDEAQNVVRRNRYNGLKGRNPEWAWIGFASADGTVVASTDGVIEGLSVAQRPWFLKARTAPAALDVHEAFLLAKYLGGDPATPPRLVDIAAPLRYSDGTLRGVLGAHLSWTWAKGIERALRAQRPRDADAELLVVSSRDEVLTGPSERSEKVLNVPSETWTDGKGRLNASARTTGRGDYPGLGWTVVARQSENSMADRARTLAEWGLVAGMILAFGAAGATFVGTRRWT